MINVLLGDNREVGDNKETYASPSSISCLFLPSKDTQAVFLADGDTVIYNK